MSSTPAVRRTGRNVLLVDATVEAVLAVGCLLLAFRLLGTAAWSLPGWLGPAVLVVLVILLVGVAGVLARLATRPEPDVLRAVAIGNIVTLVVAVAWAVVGLGAGPELRVVLVVVAVALGALAAVQLRAARS